MDEGSGRALRLSPAISYPTWDLAPPRAIPSKQFDLPLDRKIKALSRGMKMKLALAVRLAFHPRLIVLDEPSLAAIDTQVRASNSSKDFSNVPAESTVFLSSHDLAEIERLASHVAISNPVNFSFSEDMISLSTAVP